MLNVRYSTKFKKDFKLAQKRGLPMHELKKIIETLASEKALEPKHRDHALSGNYAMFRECHVHSGLFLPFL